MAINRARAERGGLLLGCAALLALGAALLAAASPASAAGTGDWPPPATGSWWVAQPTAVDNETIVVNGTLYVYLTSLHLDNVTLLINSSASATYGIYVYSGASTLTINNSEVTTFDPDYRFYFYTYGTLSIERSNIHRMSTYGIYTYGGTLTLRNNDIHNGSYSGISAYYGDSQAPLILTNNSLYAINYYAMFLQVYSYFGAGEGPHNLAADFVIRGNNVSDNVGGGIYVYRYFYDYLNTASSLVSNLTVENNLFLRNRGPALYIYNSVWNGQGTSAATVSLTGTVNITGNRVEQNAAYQAVFLVNAVSSTFSGSCRVDLALNFSNNIISDNAGAGVFIDYYSTADHSSTADVSNDGSMIFANNTIVRNQGYGLYIYRYAYAYLARNASINGTISVLGNTITNNADAGIYLFNYAFTTDGYSSLIDGPVRIENNTVVYNSGYGVYTYNYAYKYQGDLNGTAEIRGPLTVRGNEVAFNDGYNALQIDRQAYSYTGSTAYLGGDITVSNNRVYNNSGNGIDIGFNSNKYLGKASGISIIDSNLTLEDNWVANNSLYIGVSIDRTSVTYYSSASRVTGWTRIRGNLIEGHDSNGLQLIQRALNYYGSSGAESRQTGDILVENNVIRRNNQAAAYMYFYSYSYYSTSTRVEANYTVRNNTITDNQATGLFGYFYAWSDTALSGDTHLISNVLVERNDFSRNKGEGFLLYRYAVAARTPGYDAAILGSVTMRDNVARENLEEGLYVYDYVSNSQGDSGASARIIGGYSATNNTLVDNLGYYGGLVITSYLSAYETETAIRQAPVTFVNNTVRGNTGFGSYLSLSGYQYYFASAQDRGAFNDSSGFTITGNTVDANSRMGLYVNFDLDSDAATTTANPLIENNSFSGNSGTYALYLRLMDLQGFAIVRNNQISSNRVDGLVSVVTAGKGSGLLFESNTMRQNVAQNFGVRANFGGAAFNLTIDQNNVTANDVVAGPFFDIVNNGRTQVFRNTIRGGINQTGSVNISAASSSAWVTVHNNTIDGNSGKAVAIFSEGLVSVEYNTASNNSRDGIIVLTGGDYLSSQARLSIHNNTIDQNGANGVWAYATNRLTVMDNRARFNQLAGIRINFLASAPQVERNNLTGNRFGLVLSGNGTSPLTASYPLRNLTISGSQLAGLYVDDVAVSLYNSSITGFVGVDLSVRQGRIDAYGTTVGYGKGEVRASGEIHVWWNLSFVVVWQSGVPVPSALILMNGSTGAEYGQKLANATGRVPWFLAEEWSMVDANRFLWSPYTFTAIKATEEGSNTTALDRAKEVWITISDRHPPVITLDRPEDGAVYNKSYVSYAGNVTDAGSGFAGLEISMDGSLPSGVGVSPLGAFAGAFTLPDGRHTAMFRARDVAGVQTTLFVNFTVDTTPPRLIIVTPTFGITNVSLVNVTVQTDPDVVSSFIDSDSLTLRADATFSAIVRIFEGPNLFHIRATDWAGNSNETFLAITLDTTPPLLIVEEPEDGFLTNNPVLAVRGSTEPSARLLLNGIAVLLEGGGAFETAVQLTEGHNVVDLAAQDLAGNWAYLRITGVLDRSPPMLRVRSPADGLITAAEFLSVEGDIEDDALLFVNGVGVFALGAFSQSVHLNEGANTITVLARDLAGNEARVTRTVTRDTTVPFLDILDPAGGHGWTNQPSYIIRGLTEPFANVSAGAARVQAGEAGDFALEVQLSQEETILRIEAVDRIGNRNATAVTITLDTQAPALILYSPPNNARFQVSSATVEGATEFGVLLTVAGEPVQVAADGIFRWVVPLKEGPNNVTVRAVDKAGNAAEVSLILFVGSGGTNAPPPPPPSSGSGIDGATTEAGGSNAFLLVLILAAAGVAAMLLRPRLKRGRGEE